MDRVLCSKGNDRGVGGAQFVALGILFSRLMGLLRERTFAHYFGNSSAADAFKAALRIPNILQNLFGEGVLSASFIPVYAKLIGQGEEGKAVSLANIIFSVLCLISSVLVLIGVIISPWLVELLTPGFVGEKKELAVQLTRVFFPATGLLVMSAWCLGILNSHRKFFLPYAAPVVWNSVIIITLIFFGSKYGEVRLAYFAAWGVVVGSALQFLVQLPTVIKLLGEFKPKVDFLNKDVRLVIRNFFPVLIGRGVIQVSAYVDSILASLLPTGAIAILSYSQTIYLLPISLFGMSVAVAELPEMSRVFGATAEVNQKIIQKLENSLRQVAFFIMPTMFCFVFFGDLVVGAVFETGQFSKNDTYYVWTVLVGSTFGLMAVTLGRLYSSTYYAFHDTRTPLKFAVIRVTISIVLGTFTALKLPEILGLSSSWGLVGLSISSAIAGCIEYALLRKGINKLVGKVGLQYDFLLKIFFASLLAAFFSYTVSSLLSGVITPQIFSSIITLGIFTASYLFICQIVGIAEVKKMASLVVTS